MKKRVMQETYIDHWLHDIVLRFLGDVSHVYNVGSHELQRTAGGYLPRERSEESVRARTILAEHFCCCCRSINLNICVDFLRTGGITNFSLACIFAVIGTWPR